MRLQEIAINHFPSLYQIHYERKTQKKIKKYMTDDKEVMRKNIIELYKERFGFEPDLDNPKRYSELMQYRKLYGLKPEFSTLSDKIAVHKWVKEKIGEEYLIPLLGTWNNFDEIDFDSLPNSFILKTNNASGTNFIVHDKKRMNKRLARRQLKYWLKMKYWFLFCYEMQYEPLKPMILAEKLIEVKDGQELMDYKFLCFHGKAEYVWVDLGRHTEHKKIVFDRNWNPAPFTVNGHRYPLPDTIPEKPKNYEKMLQIADTLSEGFDHVRVDLYDNDGQIYFGEMTFTSASGLAIIKPDEWDYKLGDLWKGKGC